jgi:hypothetical protein
MSLSQLTVETTTRRRRRTIGLETAAALAGTGFSAILLTLTAIHAGPLWRDEVNTLNLSQMSSLRELWNNLPFESFPPLWPLILRGLGFIGGTHGDAGIRVLGLCVALLFLAALWACARWMGCPAPTLSVGLLGSLPAFIFIAGSNRAYGLASCLLVLSFGTLWRVLELPTRSRFLIAGGVCLLFAQCVYYDGIFLFAMLVGASLVAVRRQQWRTVWALLGIGGISVASLAVYIPVVQSGSAVAPMIQDPFFHPVTVWFGLRHAVSASTSANGAMRSGWLIWVWIALLSLAVIVVLAIQWASWRGTGKSGAVVPVADPRSDLALFCLVTVVFGTAPFLAFLVRLRFFPQDWYYVELLALCAVALDGILGATWSARVPRGLLRAGFIVTIMVLSARPAWQGAHTRRSNVDLVAAVLEQKASAGDLIVVQDAWEGITFDRYYRGRTAWITIPPIDSHKVHRTDLVLEEMKRPDAMAPLLDRINQVLQSNHSVWLVGSIPLVKRADWLRPPPPPPTLPTKWWFGTYLLSWNAEVSGQLLEHARQGQALKVPVNEPVSYLENVLLFRFSGYRAEAVDSAPPRSKPRAGVVPAAHYSARVATAINDDPKGRRMRDLTNLVSCARRNVSKPFTPGMTRSSFNASARFISVDSEFGMRRNDPIRLASQNNGYVAAINGEQNSTLYPVPFSLRRKSSGS